MRSVMPIVVAVVLGPLVGGIGVCLFAAGHYLVDWPLGPVGDLLGLFVLYMIFAYVLGWPIALLAGLLMSVWMSFRPPGIAGAIVAAVGSVGLLWLAAAANLLGPAPNLAFGGLGLTLAVSVFAAIACWLIVRPLASRIAA
jgi:hypothetical protein